jgi:hypothetical protein
MALGALKVNGDATAVVATDIDYNTDGSARTATGIIAPGLTGRPTAYKINGFTGYAGSNLTLESGVNRVNGNVGVVAAVLGVIQQRTTVTMYQVESASAQMSVLVEHNNWTDADLQAYIRANIANGSGNAGVYGNTVVSAATVASTGGFKLA